MKKPHAGRLWCALCLAYMALIFAVSSIARLRVPFAQFKASVRLIHGCEYGLLGVLLHQTLAAFGWRRTIIIAALIGTSYGLSDEWHQSFVPGRVASGGDIIADAIGVSLGALCASWFSRHRAAAASRPIEDAD